MDNVIAVDGTLPTELTIFDGITRYVVKLQILEVEKTDGWERKKPPLFLQCDEPWRDKRYASGGRLTFCQAACLVCSYGSLASWVGYEVDPIIFAEAIDKAKAFKGDEIGHPHRMSEAFPLLVWHNRGDKVFHSPRYDEYETSLINWGDRPGDSNLLAAILARQPVVVKVDYKPKTREIDQHFVLAYKYIPDPTGGLNDDLLIMDPMTGHTSVLTYFNPDWYGDWMVKNKVTKVERTLVGVRAWVRQGFF